MTLTKDVEIVRENWLKASRELGFEITTPYTVTLNNESKEIFAFLPRFGSSNGMYVELTQPPEFKTDIELLELARTREMFCSFINIKKYVTYEREVFEECIEDWRI
ncbi:MAG: hypothetical protein Q8O19_05320 [Rectinemataceae bacterium]|nr:hypothetical protein [Rectinemataceae bacterium]